MFEDVLARLLATLTREGWESFVIGRSPSWSRRGEERAWLEMCLRALQGQSWLPETIIVVARPQDAPAIAVVDELGNTSPLPLTLLKDQEPGQIPAIVLGLSAVKSEFVAFVDDDVEPDFRWLEELLIPMADPRVACVADESSECRQRRHNETLA